MSNIDKTLIPIDIGNIHLRVPLSNFDIEKFLQYQEICDNSNDSVEQCKAALSALSIVICNESGESFDNLGELYPDQLIDILQRIQEITETDSRFNQPLGKNIN